MFCQNNSRSVPDSATYLAFDYRTKDRRLQLPGVEIFRSNSQLPIQVLECWHLNDLFPLRCARLNGVPVMTQVNSVDLLALVRDGDSQAETELFDRYLNRLIPMVEKRISPALRQRFGPEDIVQSAYRSFFSEVRNNRVTIDESGQLWSLLAAIAINKLLGQVERHTAKKRTPAVEQRLTDDGSLCNIGPVVIADEPTPDQIVAIADELSRVMAMLDDTQGRMLRLRLQGRTIEEVAAAVGRSERTVRRLLDRLRADLEQRLLTASAH